MFRKLECRALVLNGSRTSIALEPSFWTAAECQAEAQGIKWQEWAAQNLSKPDINGRASTLRVAILEAALS